MLEGLAGFEAGEGDGFRVFVGAEVVEDGVTELVEGGGVAGEEEDGPAEKGRGGIAACQENVEELGTEFDGVLCCVGESVEEDVRTRFLFVDDAVAFLVLHDVQSVLHKVIDKGMNLVIRVSRFLVVG